MLFVFSAPSGAGKTTIIRKLFEKLPGLAFSVSATTRKKRDGEKEGRDYYFLSVDEFKKKLASGEFAEHEEVHGNLYGTLKKEIEPYLNSETDLVFDIEVKGALSVKKLYPEAVLIFLEVPVEELLRRLKNRNTESDEEIEKRASRIKMEAAEASKFDHIIDNSREVEQAVKEAEAVINSYKKKK